MAAEQRWKLMEWRYPTGGIWGGKRSVIGIQPIGAMGGLLYRGEVFDDRASALVALSEAQAQGRKAVLYRDDLPAEGAATLDIQVAGPRKHRGHGEADAASTAAPLGPAYAQEPRSSLHTQASDEGKP